MLKKNYRLSSVRLKGPRLIKTRLMVIKTAKNEFDYSRFGFVVSKRVDKRAVARNTIKRKLSASLVKIFDRIEGGRDFVFFPKKDILGIDQEKLNLEIVKIFKKEGFLND